MGEGHWIGSARLMGGKDLFTFYLDAVKKSYPEIVMEITVIDSVSIGLFQILNFGCYKSIILFFWGLF